MLALGLRWTGGARGWDILEAVVLRNGVLPLRSALVRAASSIVTQASAGAVGREGPIVLVAAATASSLGQRSGSRRASGACSWGAGSPPASPAPTTRRSGPPSSRWRSSSAASPSRRSPLLAVSSAVATLLTWAAFGHDPVFHVPALALSGPWEIGLFAALGVLGGVVAAAFLFALRASASLYSALRLPRPVAMATAGLVLGLVTLRYPEIVGNGREAIGALFGATLGRGARPGASRAAARRHPPRRGLGDGRRRLHAHPLHRGDARARLRRGRADALPGARRRAGGLRPRRHGVPPRRDDARAPDRGGDGVRDDARLRDRGAPAARLAPWRSLVATRLSANSVYTEALQRKAGEAGRRGRDRRPARGRPRAGGAGDRAARPAAPAPPRRASSPRGATTSTWSTRRAASSGPRTSTT